METSNKSTVILTNIFIISFLNLIGFGIVIPLLPDYAEIFGASPFDVGLLIGSYAAAQFIGAPLWGRLSDRFGRKPLLLITLAGSVVGYLIFGLAGSLSVLFLSRIFTGFTNGNISVAQAIVTDITDEHNRARGLGLIGAAFGLGLILGPALGGFLSHWGFEWPAYAAAFLNLLSLLAVKGWLPETRRKAVPGFYGDLFNLKMLRQLIRQPGLGRLLHIRFIFAFAFSTFATVFALYTEFGLNYSPQTTAYLLAYVGGLIVLVQSLLIAPLSKCCGERRLLFYSVILMAASLLAWAFVREMIALILVLIPLALASGVFNTVINSVLSKAVEESEVGGVLGISAALESFTRILAPSAGGFLLQRFGLGAPGVVSGLLLLLLIPYSRGVFFNFRKKADKDAGA